MGQFGGALSTADAFSTGMFRRFDRSQSGIPLIDQTFITSRRAKVGEVRQ